MISCGMIQLMRALILSALTITALTIPIANVWGNDIHRGSVSPLLQSWTIEPGDEAGENLGAAFASDPDYPDVRAWEVKDNSSNQRLRYRVPGPANNEPWVLRAKLRVVSGSNPPTVASLLEVDNGSKRYLVTFGLNSNGDTLVGHNGNIHVQPNVGSPASDYNTVEIAFRADAANPTGVAHLFINGAQVFGDLTGISHAVTRVNFGSGTTSGQATTRFAWVDWSVGEPACSDGIDNDRDGLIDFAGGDADCVTTRDPTEGVNPLLAQHVGNTDPNIEGFRGTPPSNTTDAIVTPEAAWEIDDNSTTAPPFRYQLWPESASAWEGAWSSGWTLDLRLGHPDNDPLNAASFVDVRRAGLRYLAFFGVTNNRDEARLNVAAAVVCSDHQPQRDWQLSYDGTTASLSSPGCGSTDVVAAVPHPFEEGLSFGSDAASSTSKTQFAKVAFRFSDADGDDLDAYGEALLGTLPNDADTDGDDLSDGDEVYLHNTSPTLADTDNDDLNDFDEIMIWGTDPTNPDTDGDGRSDGLEVANNSNPLDPAQAQILRQFISKSPDLDRLGGDLSIDGDFAVVGGLGTNFDPLAIVFHRDGNGIWQEEDIITRPVDPPPSLGSSRFGERIRLSGTRVLITANYEDVPRPTGGYYDWAGAAHIYERQVDGTWPRIAHLTAPEPNVTQRFGFSGDIDGDTAMVNTWRYDGFESSTIFFYQRQSNGTWLLEDEQRLSAPQRVFSIDIRGDNALLFTYAGGSNTSAYERSNGNWAKTTELETNFSSPESDQSFVTDDFAFIVDSSGVLRVHEKLGANNWVLVKTFTIDDFESTAGETATVGLIAVDGNKLVLENVSTGVQHPLILFEYEPAYGWSRTATVARMASRDRLRSMALSDSNLVVSELGDSLWFMQLSDDFDGDGLTNLQEVNEYQSGPHLEDTDLDGLLDGEEVNVYGTNPILEDTDDDTFNDGEEVAAGSDPLNPNSIPGSSVLQIPMTPKLMLAFVVVLVLGVGMRFYSVKSIV